MIDNPINPLERDGCWLCEGSGEVETRRASDDEPVTVCCPICVQNDEQWRRRQVEADKAALADQLDAAEARVERLTGALRRARNYAGDHLPAAAGTGIVHILESALRESAA